MMHPGAVPRINGRARSWVVARAPDGADHDDSLSRENLTLPHATHFLQPQNTTDLAEKLLAFFDRRHTGSQRPRGRTGRRTR